MNCATVERYVDAVLDQEVDASTQLTIERHVAECASCRDRISFARWMKTSLRRSDRVAAPEALRQRVSQALAEERSPSLVRFSAGWVDSGWRTTAAVAALALMVFGIGGALQIKGRSASASIAPLFEDVVRAHTRAYPAEVARREAVSGYFAEKVGFAVQPVEFSDPGVRFVGARHVEVGGRHAVTLQYDAGGRRMTVVAFRPPALVHDVGESVDADGRTLRYVRVGDHMVPVIEHDGVFYAVVGDLEPEDGLRLTAHASLPSGTTTH